MPYREPLHIIELVTSICALPLVAAYRLEGGGIGAPETLAWFALSWALVSAARTRWSMRRGHAGAPKGCATR
jgi:hypothetical protein